MVDEDEYILKLSRYVHLNPVFVRKVKSLPERERLVRLRSYPWSSYRSYIGEIRPLSFFNEGPVLAMMSRVKRKQRSTYRRFVEAGIGDVDAAFIDAKKRSPLCIGSDSCRERIESVYETLVEGKAKKEDASFRRVGRRCSVDDVLSVVCVAMGIDRQELLRRRRGSMVRPIAA